MVETPLNTARDVSEHLLARTGRAILEGDYDAFAACFTLPQILDTFDGRRHIETEADLRATFHDVRNHYVSLGVTEMVRHCVDAEFRDPDTVEATSETRLMRGDQLVQAAYPVFSVLKRTAQGWQVAFSQYAIVDAPTHNAALCGAKTPHRAQDQIKDRIK